MKAVIRFLTVGTYSEFVPSGNVEFVYISFAPRLVEFQTKTDSYSQFALIWPCFMQICNASIHKIEHCHDMLGVI